MDSFGAVSLLLVVLKRLASSFTSSLRTVGSGVYGRHFLGGVGRFPGNFTGHTCIKHCMQMRGSVVDLVVVSTSACHAADRGSIPEPGMFHY